MSSAEDRLRANVGVALEGLYFEVLAIDTVARDRRNERLAAILLSLPKPPTALVEQLRSLSPHLGAAWIPETGEEWVMLQPQVLPPDWEELRRRRSLAAYIIQLCAAHEWHLHELVDKDIRGFLRELIGDAASGLEELRATRNCLLHTGGQADDRYVNDAGTVARCAAGDTLPLDPAYAYDSTVQVLEVARIAAERELDGS